ncbi:Frag1/DRAM/Sfk1 family-domain-containing protein [Pestalotiopsis sp. NC0098]|nr:Frag1/DRAM/Sfk1 family-domain-containing protein [Pestalotiopsis sp. NC0098]
MKLLSYWWFPIISGVMWLATLLGLLIHWIVDTKRVHYSSMGDTQNIAYISDVGAAELKPLFVAGCIITTIFLDLSFATDRWLRHKGRLVPNTTVGEKVLSGLTIVFALIGTVGLCFLSGFDTAHYPKLHDIFLLLFIAGYLISAIFICWEYQRLGIRNREHRILRISFWVKLTFVLVELALAIAFAVNNFRKNYNVAAILEWVIAFIFSFYVFSFFIDLWPAVKTKRGMGHKTAGMNDAPSPSEMEENYHHHHSGSNVSGNPRYTDDSARALRGANF